MKNVHIARHFYVYKISRNKVSSLEIGLCLGLALAYLFTISETFYDPKFIFLFFLMKGGGNLPFV